MEELRPDTFEDEGNGVAEMVADERVKAPGEALDDRSDADSRFTVDETLATAGTGYDPTDPADY